MMKLLMVMLVGGLFIVGGCSLLNTNKMYVIDEGIVCGANNFCESMIGQGIIYENNTVAVGDYIFREVMLN